MTGEVNGKPPTIEGPGRYHVFAGPDGGWVISRAVGICDQCRSCGCGEQAELVMIPPMAIALGRQLSQQDGGLGRLKAMMKTVTGR